MSHGLTWGVALHVTHDRVLSAHFNFRSIQTEDTPYVNILSYRRFDICRTLTQRLHGSRHKVWFADGGELERVVLRLVWFKFTLPRFLQLTTSRSLSVPSSLMIANSSRTSLFYSPCINRPGYERTCYSIW